MSLVTGRIDPQKFNAQARLFLMREVGLVPRFVPAEHMIDLMQIFVDRLLSDGVVLVEPDANAMLKTMVLRLNPDYTGPWDTQALAQYLEALVIQSRA